jgi:5-methylcytosine-specific restriction enzyme subunit McrC
MDHYLYEYRNRLPIASLPPGLETYLQTIWEQRPLSPWFSGTAGSEKTSQRYLNFQYKANGEGVVSARNYVGLIQYQGHRIHLLPKVFYQGHAQPPAGSVEAIHAHLYWWLSYSERLQFPRSLANFSQAPTDWLELLILLFAQYTHELLHRTQYQYYQEVEEELSTLRGRLNFPDYVRNRAVGKQQVLPCTFDSFQPDNRFNRILKDVASRLRQFTRHALSRRLLEEIRFQLAEVSDQRACLADCDQVHLPPLFADFNVVLAYCRLFLGNHSPLASTNTTQSVFALLLPTEKIFEEFIAGFLQQHFASRFQISAQASDLYLATQHGASGTVGRFNLQHDLLLHPKAPSGLPKDHVSALPIILDTKYKTLPLGPAGPDPSSISSADMYQLTSYAVRRGSAQNYLLYPDSLSHPATFLASNQLHFTIFDRLANAPISIYAQRLPVVAAGAFENVKYDNAFQGQEEGLIKILEALLSQEG